MATYAIGDVQGCYAPLMRLLDKINYVPQADQLWFVGDLVNRGPASLATLRFIKQQNARVVLGNHDIHLLAVSENVERLDNSDTLTEILNAPDRDALINWLRQQPLLHHDPKLNVTMVHAGILPHWALKQAKRYAKEVATVIQGPQYLDYLKNLYGDCPACWDENLTAWPRLRFITNAFTRMRFVNPQGCLELKTKTAPDQPPPGYMPWFAHPNRQMKNGTIVFGHWAALMGQTQQHNVFGIDTGCVWGHQLTALRLEDYQHFNVVNEKI